MIRSALVLGAVLFGMSVEAAERLPSFPRAATYAEARERLIISGWQPMRLPNAGTCYEGDSRCEGRPEMFHCSGTGLAHCYFTWRKGTTQIEVVTSGEDNPKVSRVECRAGCP